MDSVRDKLTQARHEQILRILSRGPTTIQTIINEMEVSYFTIHRDIAKTLIPEGYVRKEGYKEGRAEVYSLISEYAMPRIQDKTIEDYLIATINGTSIPGGAEAIIARFEIIYKVYQIAYLEWAIKEYGDMGDTQQERINELKADISLMIFNARKILNNLLREIQAIDNSKLVNRKDLWRNLFGDHTRVQDMDQAKAIYYGLEDRIAEWKSVAGHFPLKQQETTEDEQSDELSESDDSTPAGEVLDSLG